MKSGICPRSTASLLIPFLMVALLICGCGRDEGSSPEDEMEFDEEEWWNQQAEEDLVGVEVDSSDLSEQLNQWIVKQADITGQWDSSYWHDGVHLTIQERADGRYDVVYHARGDLASWTLKRTASFENGVLELDKPVKEYTPFDPYKSFYLLRVSDGPRFVSHPLAKEWLVGKDPKNWNSIVVDEQMLKKTEAEPMDAPDKEQNE